MDHIHTDAETPRAEELIAGIYKQILDSREKGGTPRRVVINRRQWHIIDDYRLGLGTLDGSLPDYLAEDSLFGLEIWYGDDPDYRVE